MLSALRIQNLALVEDLSLELGRGFTVLTGETGAGKSLLVDALSLLVGARADAEAVRQGTDRATVEGVVEGDYAAWKAFLEERGLPLEQPVVLRREIGANGRGRAWINGAPSTVGDLREAGRVWMRLTSQHDHQALLAEDRHLPLVDEVLGIRADLGALVQAVKEAQARLKARRSSEAQRDRRLVELAEAIAELETLGPKAGEWPELRVERETLRHSALLEQAFREAALSLREAVKGAAEGNRNLARAVPVLPEAQGDLDRLRSAVLELEDLQALAQDRALHFAQAGVERIEKVEARLSVYEKLSRRQRSEPEELVAVLKALKEEQRALLGGSEPLSELEAQLRQVAEAYGAAATALHQRRAEALGPLEAEVHGRLARLGMKGARIQLRLALAEETGSPVLQAGRPVRLGPQGYSAMAIWIESNAGEGFRPLAKIASGGELSRLMLVLMCAGAGAPEAELPALTMVLDEVDAGIGGETALSVGEAIAELGRRHQVLAVTHLAQVAARSDHHGHLSKRTESGRTRTHHAWLEYGARVREVARLLSGHPDLPEAVEHAKTLLSAGMA